MHRWLHTTLGELCDQGHGEVQTGPFGSQLHAHEYVNKGVPIVPTNAIGGGFIVEEGLPQIAEAKASQLDRHRLLRGDILFARRGVQATGLSAIVKANQEGWICGTGAIRLRVNSSHVDPWFLSLYLTWERSYRWLRRHAVGATMPNLNEDVIRGLPIALPPLHVQRRIADVLGALDDKIDLNRRMNRTLEAMAQALFKDWFVEGDYGEEKKLTELVDLNPRLRLSKGRESTYVDMKAVPTSGMSVEETAIRPFQGGSKFENGDTLLARITPCLENGKTAFVDFLKEGEVGFGSTEFIVMRARPGISPQFVYCLARDPGFRAHAIQSMVGTSGRQRVQVDSLAHFEIDTFARERVALFHEQTRSWFEQVRSNTKEILTLQETRDYLLPKLLSGEVEVEAAEEVAGDVL